MGSGLSIHTGAKKANKINLFSTIPEKIDDNTSLQHTSSLSRELGELHPKKENEKCPEQIADTPQKIPLPSIAVPLTDFKECRRKRELYPTQLPSFIFCGEDASENSSNLHGIPIQKLGNDDAIVNGVVNVVGDGVVLEKIKLLEDLQNQIFSCMMTKEQSEGAGLFDEKFHRLDEIVSVQDILSFDCPASSAVHAVFLKFHRSTTNFQTTYEQWIEILRSYQEELFTHLLTEYDRVEAANTMQKI